MPCVPNGEFSKISKLLGNGKNNRVNVLRSESAYEPRKPWISKNRDAKFKYLQIAINQHLQRSSGEKGLDQIDTKILELIKFDLLTKIGIKIVIFITVYIRLSF